MGRRSAQSEWAWRVNRGESLANLQAFARLADEQPPHDDGDGRDSRAQAEAGS